MNYKKILNQIKAYENALLTQNLSSVTFNDIFSRILSLRKQYELDFDGKYSEASQFLSYLKTLLIYKEKQIPNTTFDSVLKHLTSLHKEFERSDVKNVFIDREIQYLDELATNMSHRTHSMTTRRLNEIAKKKEDLQKQIDLTK